MSERPIIFSGESVRAILSGRKTMTRRLVKLREFQPSQTKGYDFTFRDRQMRWHDVSAERLLAKHAPHRAGDRLWVKESFSILNGAPDDYPEIVTRADMRARQTDGHSFSGDYPFTGTVKRWRSPLFMCRSDSRLTLEVLSVRAERLQAITEEDALAEGMPDDDDRPLPQFPCRKCGGAGLVEMGYSPDYGVTWIDCDACDTPVKRFALMWDALNGKRAPWDSNPWVWVVSFRRVES